MWQRDLHGHSCKHTEWPAGMCACPSDEHAAQAFLTLVEAAHHHCGSCACALLCTKQCPLFTLLACVCHSQFFQCCMEILSAFAGGRC